MKKEETQRHMYRKGWGQMDCESYDEVTPTVQPGTSACLLCTACGEVGLTPLWANLGSRKLQLLVFTYTDKLYLHTLSTFTLGPKEGFANSESDPFGEGFANFPWD